MRKNSPNEPPRRDGAPPPSAGARPDGEESTLFGLERDDDLWMERLRAAEEPDCLGSIGPHELLEEVSRGGQGVVWRARQAGTGREFAIKRLLAGSFASPRSRRRFEREIEIASTLTHPGIVTVYGLDVVDEEPYLAMEWVDGVPLTEWSATVPRDRAGRRALLATFLEVCDAVQNAHHNGVLHRDLKPSNILVDAEGRPRVLDFGLAKTFDDDVELTLSADFLGTPAYASPEQLGGGEARLDARSDVYALGVVLFEALTGQRPRDTESGLRKLLESFDREDPTPPSRLVRGIDAELDAIVLTALASRREERYQTVDALASDLRRYLAGEPISAHAPTALYRLRKLVRRNPEASGLAALLFVSVCAFAGITWAQAAELETQRDAALAAQAAAESTAEDLAIERDRAEEAADLAARARDDADAARRDADDEARAARATLDFLIVDMIKAALPAANSAELTVREVLESAASRAGDAFGDDPKAQIAVRHASGSAFLQLSRFDDAVEQGRAAVELAREVRGPHDHQLALLLHFLGRALSGSDEVDAAHAALEEAIEIYALHVDEHPSDLVLARIDLSQNLVRAGRLEEARAFALETIELNQRLGLADRSDAGIAHAQLAWMKQLSGDLEGAIESYEVAAELLDPDERGGELEMLLTSLGNLRITAGDLEGAEEALRRAIELQRAVYGDAHRRVGMTLGSLSTTVAMQGRADEALELAVEGKELVLAAMPRESRDASVAHHCVGSILYYDFADLEGAEAEFRASMEILDALFGVDHPEARRTRAMVARICHELGRDDEARALLAPLAEGSGAAGGAGATD